MPIFFSLNGGWKLNAIKGDTRLLIHTALGVYVWPRRGDLFSSQDLHVSARHNTPVPLSMENNVFVLHHNASTLANKPDCHYRSCFNYSKLQRINFVQHTRRWPHTECLRDSTVVVIVCLEHRHYALGFVCACVCCCCSCYVTDHSKY